HRPADMQISLTVDDRDARRVISPIFEALQPLDQKRLRKFPTDIGDNSTHAGHSRSGSRFPKYARQDKQRLTRRRRRYSLYHEISGSNRAGQFSRLLSDILRQLPATPDHLRRTSRAPSPESHAIPHQPRRPHGRATSPMAS